MRQPQVDKDCKFDNRHQDNRKSQAPLHKQDDKEDCHDGNSVYHLEIPVRHLDHVLGAGRLPDQHSVSIIFFHDFVEAVDLVIDLIAGRFIFRID